MMAHTARLHSAPANHVRVMDGAIRLKDEKASIRAQRGSLPTAQAAIRPDPMLTELAPLPQCVSGGDYVSHARGAESSADWYLLAHNARSVRERRAIPLEESLQS